MLTKEQRIEIARKFGRLAKEKFKDLIKSVVIFGSSLREEFKERSDIDILVIIDDTIVKHCEKDFEHVIDLENKIDKCPRCGNILRTGILENYLEEIDKELEKIANSIDEARIKIKDKVTNEEKIINLISLQPSYKLTEFWDYVRSGHPIVYNFIKDGYAVIDDGTFRTFQNLWLNGKIPLTREAIEKYIEDAPKKIIRAKSVKLLQIAEDCYYAIVNSAQALLMFLGKAPPTPSKLYEEFKKELVDKNLVEQEYAEWIREIVELRKKIEHQEIRDIKGEEVDLWIERAQKFVEKMIILLSVLEIKKIESIASKTREVSRELMKRALKTLNVEFNEENLVRNFIEKFIKNEYISPDYIEILKRIDEIYSLILEGKIHKVNFEEVYKLRESVRLMIRDVAKVLENLERKKE
ncbi:MAG: nucleotidyltransferase domain-containing protein [Candidatus Aenigmatarchaeota archaeon]|nr:nucleotidyltransferase domain-containing protein [Candidatus Aenigmarchaeota archaeon]